MTKGRNAAIFSKSLVLIISSKSFKRISRSLSKIFPESLISKLSLTGSLYLTRLSMKYFLLTGSSRIFHSFLSSSSLVNAGVPSFLEGEFCSEITSTLVEETVEMGLILFCLKYWVKSVINLRSLSFDDE